MKKALLVPLFALGFLGFAPVDNPHHDCEPCCQPVSNEPQTSMAIWRTYALNYPVKGNAAKSADRAARYADAMLEEEIARFGAGPFVENP